MSGWVPALLIASLLGPPAQAADDDFAADLLRRAVQRTFPRSGVRSVELRIRRDGRLVARRGFDLADRRDDGRRRFLVRFTAPSHLRGNALLVLELPERRTGAWIYQATDRRARRVGVAHEADSFYGSDLSLDELDPLDVGSVSVERLDDAMEAGARFARIAAIPRRVSQYRRLVVWIDPTRVAVARIDFHRDDAGAPVKRLRVDLDGAAEASGRLAVRDMRLERVGSDALTEIHIAHAVADPAIPEDVFTRAFLAREGEDLYAWVGQRGAPSGGP